MEEEDLEDMESTSETPKKVNPMKKYYVELYHIREDFQLWELIEKKEDNEHQKNDEEILTKNMELCEELQKAQSDNFAEICQKTVNSLIFPLNLNPSSLKDSETPNSSKKENPVKKYMYYAEKYNIGVDVELEELLIKMEEEDREDALDHSNSSEEELFNIKNDIHTWTKSVDFGEVAEIPTSSTSEPPKTPKKANPIKKYYEEKCNIGDVDVELEELLIKMEKEDLEDDSQDHSTHSTSPENVVSLVENPPHPSTSEKPKKVNLVTKYYEEMDYSREDIQLVEFFAKMEQDDLEDNEDGEEQKKNMELREELQMAQRDNFAKLCQETGCSFGTGNPLYPSTNPSSSKVTKTPSSNKKGSPVKKYHEENYNTELKKFMAKISEENWDDVAGLVKNPPNPSTSEKPRKVNLVRNYYAELHNVGVDVELEELLIKMEEEDLEEAEEQKKNMELREKLQKHNPSSSKDSEIQNSSKKVRQVGKYYEEKYSIGIDVELEKFMAKMREENWDEVNATSSEKEEHQKIPEISGRRRYEFTKEDLYGYD